MVVGKMSFQSMIVGCIHAFFGFMLIALQVTCYIILHYYYQNGLFEGRFGPGAWLGSVVFITGIIGIVHGCSDPHSPRYNRLRTVVIIFNLITAVVAVVMLGFAIGWQMLDPEKFLFEDCEYPFVPWIYYFAPHCEAAYHVRILGATMMAIACFEVIFGFVGSIIVRRAGSSIDKTRRQGATDY